MAMYDFVCGILSHVLLPVVVLVALVVVLRLVLVVVSSSFSSSPSRPSSRRPPKRIIPRHCCCCCFRQCYDDDRTNNKQIPDRGRTPRKTKKRRLGRDDVERIVSLFWFLSVQHFVLFVFARCCLSFVWT